MTEHVNFYENVKEAEIRLKNTIVLYDNEPYFVLCVCDHKPDEILRIYLDPVGLPSGMECQQGLGVPYEDYPDATGKSRGEKMDDWMAKNKTTKILRKHMNSPLFNRFRPFPLGMCNIEGKVTYIERQPLRNTYQGLTSNMLNYYAICLSPSKNGPLYPDFTGSHMRSTIKGEYPSAFECLTNLLDPEVINEGAAFHREFALLRGPVDTLYLAYRSDIVGMLPNRDFSLIRLAKEFQHTKEVVNQLGLFGNIIS